MGLNYKTSYCLDYQEGELKVTVDDVLDKLGFSHPE